MLFFSFLYRTDQSWPELGIKDVSGCLGCGNASHIAFLELALHIPHVLFMMRPF